jgi:hypothetical protein
MYTFYSYNQLDINIYSFTYLQKIINRFTYDIHILLIYHPHLLLGQSSHNDLQILSIRSLNESPNVSVVIVLRVGINEYTKWINSFIETIY